jgi:4-hydroxy-tetrahydrodipicolinate synthase
MTAFPKGGIIAALAIPTDTDGSLMKHAMARHLAWLKSCGIHGVLALGSTGEFPFFTLDERKAILDTVAELAAPLPVLANISDLRPQTAIALGKHAQSLGIMGAALMPPWFYPVSDADQLAFFLTVAEAVPLPILLYNFPERTGNRITPETIAAFADRAPLAGIKQSGTEFHYHETLVALGEEKGFSVFTGSDTRLPEAFAIGAAGGIGGLVNFVPEEMVALYRICREGQSGDIEPHRARMSEVGSWMGRMSFPLNVAAGMQARGLDPGHPKSVVSSQSRALYAEVVTGLRECFTTWRLPLVEGK